MSESFVQRGASMHNVVEVENFQTLHKTLLAIQDRLPFELNAQETSASRICMRMRALPAR